MTNIKGSTTINTEGGIVVTITNNLKIPVDIYDVNNPSTDTQVLPFIYTKLGTIDAGSKSAITTITTPSGLQAMYTGTVLELDNKYYYQFPIKYMSGTQRSLHGTPLPLIYTIEETDRLASIKSFMFHKFAMANPGSALTINLNKAVKTENDNAIDAFFAGTLFFNNCTQASWIAIITWLQQFTSGWQGPYYLYQKPPSPYPADYVPQLLATLNILSDAQNNSATLRICKQLSNGDPIYNNPPLTYGVIMAGDGTMVESKEVTDISLKVTPVWMNVIQTNIQSDEPVTNYLIGSAVCGKLGEMNVVSFQTARQIPGKPADSKKVGFFDSLFSSASSTLSTLVGLIMLYEFVAKAFNKGQAEKEVAKRDAKSTEDLKAEEEKIDNKTSADISNDFNSHEATQILETATDVTNSYAESSKALQAETLSQTIEDQRDEINNEISSQFEHGLTPSKDFDDAYNKMEKNFDEASKAVKSGDFEKANTEIKSATSSIESAIKTSGEKMGDWETSALKQSSENLKEASETTEELTKSEKEFNKDQKDPDHDSGFDPNDNPPEVDPIEI